MTIAICNYLHELRQHCGPYVTNNVFCYGKISLKISKLNCHLLFLKTCKREGILPRFVQFKIPSTHQCHQRAIRICYHEILTNEIKIRTRQINECYKIYNNLKTLIATDVDNDTIDPMSIIMNEIKRDKATLWTTTHSKKITCA